MEPAQPTAHPSDQSAFGACGANLGTGQRRFWFTPTQSASRRELYDRVAGILLRQADPRAIVSALYLYPPEEPTRTEGPQQLVFMLLLEERRRRPDLADAEPSRHSDGWSLGGEYDRLTTAVLTALAWPSRGPSPPA